MNNKIESSSERTNKIENNINYNENQSNMSSLRTGKRLQQYNQDENLYTIQTISNTNDNNNTINIMDSLRISENSEEDLEGNNPFLADNEDQSSNVHLNISGIAADLISIKNENISKKPRAAEKIRENNQYSPIEMETNNRNLDKEKAYNKYINNVYENIDSNSFYDKQPPGFTQNKNVKYSYNLRDQVNLEKKKLIKPIANLSNLKHMYYNLDNETPRSKKNQYSLNNEKLKNFGNSISPIKNNEKVKFTEKEIEELISKYLEQNIPKDNSNNINQLKNFAKNFSLKSAVDKNKLKNLIINEVKNDKSLDVEIDNQNDYYSRKANESENQSYKSEKYSNALGTFNKQRSGLNPQENSYLIDVKSEKDQKLKDIFNKIPEIISEFNNKRGKIFKENSESEKTNAQFFNLNNLGKWIDLSKTNLWKNIANNNSNNDSNSTGKDILNEADSIINKHVLKMKKDGKNIETQNNLNLKVENILKNVNEYNKKSIDLETETSKSLNIILSKELHEESKETLDKKVNYIYDLLKNFSHTKLKDLITNPITKQISKEEIGVKNLNESIQMKENTQRFANKEILFNKKLENEIECTIRKDDKEILFSDNKKISFEVPKASMRIREDEESNLFDECKENNANDLSSNLLLSPGSKNNNVSNFRNLESHLINSEISEIKKENVAKSKLIQQLGRENPYETIEKKEEKSIENDTISNKPEILESMSEKKDISPTRLKKKSSLNKNESNNKINVLTVIDNGIKENLNKVNNESIEQDRSEADSEENQKDLVSKRINFTDKINENENEESLDYELGKGNQDKEELECEENKNFYEDEHNEEGLEEGEGEELNEETENHENIYSEEEPRSLDNYLNKLNNSTKIEDKSQVKFEKFLHSNSTKIISSRNIKTKNYENLRSDFENGIEENQKNNHSDLEIEKEKIDTEIKAELDKNVISETPIVDNQKQSKVKFSEKLVFIEYEDESLAENIKVYNQAGKPEKHNKFNLLKYLIRIKNNKFKSKKILRYYYNGIRDDKLPKKFLSNLKRTNSFSEYDKELCLKKLNEFLSECKKENQLSDVKEQQKKRIGIQN